MDGVDVAQRAALRAHDEGARLDAVARVADAAEPVAVGDAGGREEDVFALDEVVEVEDLVDVHAFFFALLTVFVVARPELALHVAADALDGAGSDDGFRRAADSHEEVDSGIRFAGGERSRYVSVGDEADTGVDGADLFDELFVARPVEDDYRDVFDGFAQCARDGADVVGRAGFDVDGVSRVRTGRYLVHVEDMLRVVHRPALCEGDDADCVRQTVGGEARSVDRVYGDVDLRLDAAAEFLSVEEHRRFVFFAFSDDDDSVHLDSVEHEAHGVDGGSVDAVFVAAAHPAPRGHSGGLGGSYHFKR